jgi:hypothetical protein
MNQFRRLRDCSIARPTDTIAEPRCPAPNTNSIQDAEARMYDTKNLARLKVIEANAQEGWKGSLAFD